MSAANGREHSLRLLLARGAAVDSESTIDRTPLHCAAEKGHHECARVLLEHGAAVNCLSVGEFAPLHFAAAFGYFECVRLLLNSGAALQIVDEDGDSPLRCAARYHRDGEQLDCARLLLSRGAALEADVTPLLAENAADQLNRHLAFALLWRGAAVPAPEELYEGDEEDAAEHLLFQITLAEWQSGRLRAWRSDTHALFPPEFRADVALA